MRKETLIVKQIIVVIFLLSLWSNQTTPVSSQASAVWSDPLALNLQIPGFRASYPLIAAYDNQVHVVTTVNASNEESGITESTSNLILHTYWNGNRWDEPIDILVAPDGRGISAEQLRINRNERIHLLWFSQGGSLYWSKAALGSANMAGAWRSTAIASRVTSGDLLVHNEQEVAIVYIENSRELTFQRTDDGGTSWPIISSIWSPPTNDQASRNVRLTVDQSGIYHVTWTETDIALNWNPSGIWYARSLDEGRSWQDFYYLPNQGSYINVIADEAGILHLLWNQNVGSTEGRFYTWSENGGQSWQEPVWIMAGLSGRTGYPRLATDSSGALHQITAGRGFGRDGGIYHSLWSGEQWLAPTLISNDIPFENNEGPDVTVTHGNQLHVVWFNWALNDIVYASHQTDAPQVRTEFDLPMTDAPPEEVLSEHQEDGAEQEEATLQEPKEIDVASFVLTSERQEAATSPYNSLFISLAPSLLLIVAVLIWRRIR